MSRIGKVPVVVPESVKLTIEGQKVTVEGPKGSLSLEHSPQVKIVPEAGLVSVKKVSDLPTAAAQYGLVRTLVANMVIGVTEGFERRLEINGVGYRAAVSGRNVTLNVGYSHPVVYNLPANIEAKVEGNVIIVSGIDKQQVGQVAAELRATRKPEPYKGKGIAYAGEQIRRKAGKTASK